MFLRIGAFVLFSVALACAQDTSQKQPPMRVNVLNVCSPSSEDVAELKSALDKVPARASFARDFEITRGHTTEETESSYWMRIRRDFSGTGFYSGAQFSLSSDGSTVLETLVFRVRDGKDILQLAIDNEVSGGGATPLTVVATDTPARRIKVERFGKASAVLMRCPQGDQSKFEAVFAQASKVLASYRAQLGLRGEYKSDVAWLTRVSKITSSAKAAPAEKK